jgi:hypothetical protein
MSHSFEEPTFKGKLVSELNKQERGQYRRENLKRSKKAVKKGQSTVISSMINSGIITENGIPNMPDTCPKCGKYWNVETQPHCMNCGSWQ